MKKCFVSSLIVLATIVLCGCKSEPKVSQEKLPIIRITSEDGKNDFVIEPVSAVVKNQKTGWISDPNDPQLTAPDPYYVNCNVDVSSNDSSTLLSGVKAEVKVRGNWTTDYEKKPLRIKFNKKQSMLGLNENQEYKNWVLLASYKDWSLLRDSVGFKLSEIITDGYVSDSQLVNVYINNQYWGVYLLCEQQQVNEGRIDITSPSKNYQGTDIGYLMEFDGYYESEENHFEMDYLNYTIHDYTKTKIVPNNAFNIGYTLKSDIYSDFQIGFIKKYMDDVWKICNEAKRGNYLKFNNDRTELEKDYSQNALECISKAIDINSLVDTYIVQEIVCDPDIYWSSFYMDVDLKEGKDNRLRFEAPWDFDSSLGNKVRACENSKGIYAGKAGRDVNDTYDAANPWMVLFAECDWFSDLVKEKYKTIDFSSVYELIENDIAVYEDEFNQNFKRWSGTRIHQGVLNELNAKSKKCKSEKASGKYLDKWLHNRIDYLDTIWK